MRRNGRVLAVLVAVAVASAGCGSSSKPQAEKSTGKYGSGVDLDVGGTKKAEQGEASQTKTTSGGTQSGTASHTTTKSSGDGFKPDLSKKPTDGGDAGVNAFFYLNKEVPSLVVEIDAVKGYEPTQAAISLLNQRLTGVADKPGGIRFLPVSATVEPREVWSMADILQAEQDNRDTHNTREQASIYLLYVNGEPDRTGPIGIAYSGSSDVIFIEQIRGVATPLVGAEGIEKATVVHEVGHLLALVNQTYTSPRDHEDPEHRGHSKNEESVMYWAVELVNVVQLLGGKTDPPNAFDDDDLADLADLKSGKLP